MNTPRGKTNSKNEHAQENSFSKTDRALVSRFFFTLEIRGASILNALSEHESALCRRFWNDLSIRMTRESPFKMLSWKDLVALEKVFWGCN